MKKLLTLLGAASIAVSASSTSVFATTNTVQKQDVNQQNILSSQTNTLTTQGLFDSETQENVSFWPTLNSIVDLDFGDSNDYMPWVEAYTNSWTDFGWKIVFPEGDVNVMRLVKLVYSAYNETNFQPIEDLLNKGMLVFDYVTSLESHAEDKVAVIYELINDLVTEIKNSPMPFNAELVEQLTSVTNILKFLKNQKIGLVSSILTNQVQNLLGMSLEELGQNYKGIFQSVLKAINIANSTLAMFKGTLPGIVFNYIMNSINTISNQMINADKNHNGVEWKVKYYVSFQGFSPRN